MTVLDDRLPSLEADRSADNAKEGLGEVSIQDKNGLHADRNHPYPLLCGNDRAIDRSGL